MPDTTKATPTTTITPNNNSTTTAPPPPSSTIISRPPPSSVTYDLSDPHRIKITLPKGSTWSSGLHWHETHDEYLVVVSGTVHVRLGDSIRTVSASPSASASGPGAAEVKVEKGVWHEWFGVWGSEDVGDGDDDGDDGATGEGEGDVVVVERTEPEDGEKAVFFRALNGVLLRQAGAGAGAEEVGGGRGQRKGKEKENWGERLLGEWWTMVALWTIFRELDNWPVLVDFPRLLCGGRVLDAGDRGVRAGGLLRRLDRGWTHAVLIIASWVGWVLGITDVRKDFLPEEDREKWLERPTGVEKHKVA